jgi:hypothetical protein
VLAGYIDESEDKTKTLFTLSCLTGDYGAWFWIEQEWLKVLNAKNVELAAQGRKTISRYHASACASRLGEFKGWSLDEQLAFVKDLLAIFERYRLDVASYTINLAEMQDVLPETKANPYGFAYLILLSYLMDEIMDHTFTREPREAIRLFHDRSDFDGVYLDAFNLRVDDLANTALKRHFLSITPMGWENCIPLQLADLMAFENMKDSESNILTSRDRRKSLVHILDRGQMGGTLRGITRDTLLEFRQRIDSSDDESRAAFWKAARINVTPDAG